MMLPLLLALSFSLGADRKVDCDKVCAKATDACAKSCKKKKKEKPASAKQCDAQCDMVVTKCKDQCKAALAPKTDASKAAEIKKKAGIEEDKDHPHHEKHPPAEEAP